jgi:cytoskeletal protein CcmA (bactofilin family)
MFRKEPGNRDTIIDDSEVSDADAVPDRNLMQDFSTRTVSYVGPAVFFKGEITAHEGLIIEGEMEGTIRHDGRNFTVGKQGRVRAEIHAKVIDVRGRIDGEIFGEELVHLHPTAVVTGTINCTRILMDDGAEFNGTVKMKGEAAKPAKKALKIADKEGKLTKVAG